MYIARELARIDGSICKLVTCSRLGSKSWPAADVRYGPM